MALGTMHCGAHRFALPAKARADYFTLLNPARCRLSLYEAHHMRENYTLTRLYVAEALAEGGQMSLLEKQVHYLGNVLRKKEGDVIRVFNGRDGEWLSLIHI